MAILRERIVDELSRAKFIRRDARVNAFTLFPPASQNCDASCRVTLNRCKPDLDDPDRVIDKVFESNGFVNIKLNLRNACELILGNLFREQNSEALTTLNSSPIAIEHTSMTPVYPINLSTGRITAVGNALACLLRSLGSSVSTHFWVDDFARQLDLLSSAHTRCLTIDGKDDHTIGRAFTEIYLQSKGLDPTVYKREIEAMFPLFGTKRGEAIETDLEKISIAKRCAIGFSTTLANLNFHISNWEFSSEFSDSDTSYHHRNTSLFDFLINGKKRLIVVASRRQRSVILDALSKVRTPEKVATFIPVGDVIRHGHSSDKIRDFRFSSLDEIFGGLQAKFSLDEKDASRLLKVALLHCAPSRDVHLDDSNFESFLSRERALSRVLNSPKTVELHAIRESIEELSKDQLTRLFSVCRRIEQSWCEYFISAESLRVDRLVTQICRAALEANWLFADSQNPGRFGALLSAASMHITKLGASIGID